MSRLNLPFSCKEVEFRVSARELSFDQGLYRESLTVTCTATKDATTATWTGSIPLTLLAPLERHPRLLDFMDLSLAARELSSQASRAAPLMEDIDIVRLAPVVSMNYLTAAIESPSVPWAFVRDSIAIDSELTQTAKLLSFKSAGIEQPPALPLP